MEKLAKMEDLEYLFFSLGSILNELWDSLSGIHNNLTGWKDNIAMHLKHKAHNSRNIMKHPAESQSWAVTWGDHAGPWALVEAIKAIQDHAGDQAQGVLWTFWVSTEKDGSMAGFSFRLSEAPETFRSVPSWIPPGTGYLGSTFLPRTILCGWAMWESQSWLSYIWLCPRADSNPTGWAS